jgi:hypothetical protein
MFSTDFSKTFIFECVVLLKLYEEKSLKMKNFENEKS